MLFADLKDSTELIRCLDPEAAQQLLDPALHRMMDAVHRYEGTVNQVLGDGIMALFGAPIAHEDHALRACYAALAMQAAMRRYTEEVRRTHGLELRMRVGLNSGEVVVRAIGNDLHMDYSAVGQTTHLAARMEQLATPGSIRLTAATLRLVGGLGPGHALGPVPVKGLAEPVEVFELVGASAHPPPLPGQRGAGAHPLCGAAAGAGGAARRRWRRPGRGMARWWRWSARPGWGSRAWSMSACMPTIPQGWRVLESASVSYGKATPYFPVIDLLKRYCHVEEHDDARTIRAKVTGQVLTLDEALQDTLPALLSLLDALPEDSPFLHARSAAAPPAHARRPQARAAAREPGAAAAAGLRGSALDRCRDPGPARQPGREPAHGPAPAAGQLPPRVPARLGQQDLLHATAARPAAARRAPTSSCRPCWGTTPAWRRSQQLLIARTEGNPFFLEESVRTLVETGVLVGEPGPIAWRKPLPTIQVPATVQAVLAARIDRLPPEEKRLLQTAAVIGTEVPLPLLQAIAEMPEDAVQRGLAHLQAAEFLYETRLFPEPEYTFKHALTHEVAYGSLLQERRRALHARIVEALEALAGDRVGEQVERLAHHALRGEVWDKALAYCRQAGEKALARSAHREAVGSFEQALSALAHLPEQRDHTRAGHRSPARPALGAPPTWRFGAYPGLFARGREPRRGPRRPSSAGPGLVLSVKLFLHHGRV